MFGLELTIGYRATTGLDERNGRGSNGGIWEWTSTLFDTHDGLSPTKIFPGYSTDFFDTKHHVVVRSSKSHILSLPNSVCSLGRPMQRLRVSLVEGHSEISISTTIPMHGLARG